MTTPNQKQPFKLIEIPLNKFHDEAIPHHAKMYDQHKAVVQKLISTNKTEQMNKEIKDKKKVIRQLKDLMYELDTLRTQVQDSDLNKFDDKTFSLRKTITCLIKDYALLEKQVMNVNETQNQINENIENENPFQAASQLQLQQNLNEIKLAANNDRLQRVEALNEDIEDLHGLYVDINRMVAEQAEPIEVIENNVESTQQHVDAGLKHLVKASKLKTAAYPMTGALIGTLVGGPLGLVAGLKVGGMAAIGCGLAGYTGGRIFKKCNDNDIATTENAVNQQESSSINHESETVAKKDK